YTLYSFILTLGAVITLPYWLFQAVRRRKYLKNFRQRLGFGLPQWDDPRSSLWIHAVSVGEVLAAKPLMTALRRQHPQIPLIVSTVTLTGQALAAKELTEARACFFFPFDWSFCVRRFLARFRPRAVVLLETEVWPNFIRGCALTGVPVFLANGRISDRSAGRYRWLRGFFKNVLMSVAAVGVQSTEDRKRFEDMGAASRRIHVTGNLKFDFPPPETGEAIPLLRQIRDHLGAAEGSPVIVIGSSMKGEEPLFVGAYGEILHRLPQARLVLAPRHPERFDEVERIVAQARIPYLRRSLLAQNRPGEARILILDSIGELRSVYSLASITVIGGSFSPHGGHNLLEPASWGKAIVFGPYMSNFREAARLFLREQAARQCTPETLPEVLTELLVNDGARSILGRRALLTLQQNQGATAATLAFLRPALE
ncbi:MAG: 3-deoxy-D-manno-octulosonic acid transferase, partial [Acidobacteriota bacterium]